MMIQYDEEAINLLESIRHIAGNELRQAIVSSNRFESFALLGRIIRYSDEIQQYIERGMYDAEEAEPTRVYNISVNTRRV